MLLFSASNNSEQQQQTIRNPKTNRFIGVHGKTYQNILHNGGYIVHKNQILPILHKYLFNNKDSDVSNLLQKEELEPRDEHDEGDVTLNFLTPHVLFLQKIGNNTSSEVKQYLKQNLAFVDKPPNILSVPSRQSNEVSTSSLLQKESEGSKPCHRLDKDTSGILAFAFNKESHQNFSLLFQNREIKKHYIALVYGIISEDSGFIDEPIGKRHVTDSRSGNSFNRWVIHGDKPRNATTIYQVLQRFPEFNYTRVLLKPLTVSCFGVCAFFSVQMQ